MLFEHELVRKGLARWHNGRLIPIIRGGDGRDEPLFTLPPDDFTDLDDTELAALGASLRARVAEVHAGRRESDVVGDRTQSQVAEEMQAAVLGIEAIDAELAARNEQEAGYDSTLGDLAARAGVNETSTEGDDGGDTGTGEGDDTGDEGDEGDTAGDGEPATTAAAATAPATRTNRPLPAARRHRPVQTEDDGTGLRVTSHASGLGAQYAAMSLLNRDLLGEFLTDIVRKNRVQPGQKAVLAHASVAFPSDRILSDGPDSYLSNSRKIRAIINPDSTSMKAMTASGPNCAPLPAIYELPGVETPARPVRGSLPSFQAVRGGAQLGTTPTMGDYTDAVGVVTAADNAAGGTLAVKNCMRIECPDFEAVNVDSIYQCIEADNLAARAYPELMSRIADLVNAEQARLADTRLLEAIKQGSSAVTYGTITPGALYWFLGAIYQAAAGIRSRNRMPDGATLQALLPTWLIDLLALDIARGQFDRFQTRAQIEQILRTAGIIPTFYLDGPSTGTGQIFDHQGDGALIEFPDVVQWALFPTGTWLHLDSGELQLGVVRDSSLNRTNDFQIFYETWENVGKIGVESMWLTTALCPNGEVALPAEAAACAT